MRRICLARPRTASASRPRRPAGRRRRREAQAERLRRPDGGRSRLDVVRMRLPSPSSLLCPLRSGPARPSPYARDAPPSPLFDVCPRPVLRRGGRGEGRASSSLAKALRNCAAESRGPGARVSRFIFCHVSPFWGNRGWHMTFGASDGTLTRPTGRGGRTDGGDGCSSRSLLRSSDIAFGLGRTSLGGCL